MEETRHPTHRRYRWWSGMLKGAVAGASPTGPWTDRRTGVRTPDHDERQPWRIPLDRPCLLPYLTQKFVYSVWTFLRVRTRPFLSVGEGGGPWRVYVEGTDQASRVPTPGGKSGQYKKFRLSKDQ